MKTFPIMIKPYSSEKYYIPWDIISPHENQALENHGQSLVKLADRGGLSWDEAYDVLTDQKTPYEKLGQKEWTDYCEKVVKRLVYDFLHKQDLIPTCSVCRDGQNKIDEVDATISTEHCTYMIGHVKVNYCPACGRSLVNKNILEEN